jgi:hypothetical protein
MALSKYGQYLPKMIFDTAMVEAFVDESYHELHLLCDLRPWEMSPLRAHLFVPARDETPADYRGRPWFASHWKIMAIREKLLQLAKQGNVKPSRAAQMRMARKAQEDAMREEGTARGAV